MDQRLIADRYEVTDRIGGGGGGVVYRATDRTLGRTVAVKEVRIPVEPVDDRAGHARDRALREARSAARLNHPSVVSIYDVIDSGDTIHIVMEHVDAPSLATLVAREGPLPPERAARIGLDVLAALEIAHAAGVVHRDIKPSNIMVPAEGPAVVTDFGIAALQDETRLTAPGLALGTPDYIAPEQARGRGDVGPACDLWSLGATLHTAVEGTSPFRREGAIATVHAVLTDDPEPAPSAGQLAPVLRELLAKEPADRPSIPGARRRLTAVVEARPAPDDRTTRVATPPPPSPGPGPDPGSDAGPVGPPPAVPPPVTQGDADAVSAPEDDWAPATTGGGGRRAGGIVLGVLLAAGVVAALLALTNDDGGEDPAVAASATDLASDGSGEAGDETGDEASDPQSSDAESEAQSGAASEQPSAEPSDEPSEAATGIDALPEGWVAVEHAGGRVGVPEDWSEEDAPGGAVAYVAPGRDVYLRFGGTDDPAPDVLANSQQLRDGFADRYGSYEEVRLEQVEYRGFDAVLWEYTYQPGERRLHALHLNFSDGDRAHVLNYQGPDEDWDELAGRFDTFMRTFEQQ